MTGASEPAAERVERLAEEWIAAERRGDVGFLGRVLTDDFVGVGPLGFLLTKEQWLQRIESGALRYEALNWGEAATRVYGDAAIVVGRQTSRATYQGHDTGGELRATLIFVRSGEEWRLAGVQFSPIGPPPGTGRG